MLTRSSEVMQRYRVAWEQVVDLDDNFSFKQEYNKTKNDLNMVPNTYLIKLPVNRYFFLSTIYNNKIRSSYRPDGF